MNCKNRSSYAIGCEAQGYLGRPTSLTAYDEGQWAEGNVLVSGAQTNCSRSCGRERALTGDASERRSRPAPRVGWFVLALLGVVAIQSVYGVVVFFQFGPEMASRGQFGDIFGGVNALFTGLAFAGLIYTILLQRRELELQRDELRLTREELHRSAREGAEQASW